MENNQNVDNEPIVEDVKKIVMEDDKKDRKPLLLLIILLLALLFLGISIGFALSVNFSGKTENVIDVGSIIFSYEEGRNSIEINNAYPTADEIGKNLSKENEYFDFIVSVGMNKSQKKELTYEIALLPMEDNSIKQEDIRVYLTENNRPILVNNKEVNTFSELENSKIKTNAKVIYQKTVSSDTANNYVFRMWLSDHYQIDETVRTFRCMVIINTY